MTLEKALLIKSTPKFNSKRFWLLFHAGGHGVTTCEICKRVLLNPRSILIHQGGGCQKKQSIKQFKIKQMKVLTEGHLYQLSNFENKDNVEQQLQFIQKEPIIQHGTELRTVSDGTTNEEVLEVLIDRMKYLQAKFPCKENACCITHLEEGLMWLEKRTRDRVKRNVEGKQIA